MALLLPAWGSSQGRFFSTVTFISLQVPCSPPAPLAPSSSPCSFCRADEALGCAGRARLCREMLISAIGRCFDLGAEQGKRGRGCANQMEGALCVPVCLLFDV